MILSKPLKAALCCPHCQGELESQSREGVVCKECSNSYSFAPDGPLDVRLQKECKQKLEIEVGRPPSLPDEAFFTPLKMNTSCEFNLEGMEIPKHLFKELVSYIPMAKHQESIALDLGCGKTPNKEIIE